MDKKNKNKNKTPFVSICTPTFNRRPFIPFIIKCFEHQDYPKDKIEWIIVDDGTDKIEDLVQHIPQVKYYKFDKKMTLGMKRNICHEKSIGDIILYMDDDDYYPPQRITHAVNTLREHPKALCAGSSEMYIYFKHIQQMYKFGPYGPNHSTAATFAFRRELLKETSFDNNASVAEEKHFLKNYTIPFVQLDSMKSILVFSHIHNSFDKKDLLTNPTPHVILSDKSVDDFISDKEIKKFFLEDIDNLLNNYDLGNPNYKPDVVKQLDEIKKKREEMIKNETKKIEDYNKIVHSFKENNRDPHYENKISELTLLIKELTMENKLLKDKVHYFEDKVKTIIKSELDKKKTHELSV